MSRNRRRSSRKRRSAIRKRPDSFILGVIAATVLVLVAAVYFGAQIGARAEVAADSQASLTVDASKYDWGTVDINGGLLSHTFSIENTGAAPLKLYDVKTSCMCTTAQLRTENAVSDKYTMHGKTNDVLEVAAGESAELLIEFDPAYHGPSGIGPVTRAVYVATNAEDAPTLTFVLNATVMSAGPQRPPTSS